MAVTSLAFAASLRPAKHALRSSTDAACTAAAGLVEEAPAPCGARDAGQASVKSAHQHQRDTAWTSRPRPMDWVRRARRGAGERGNRAQNNRPSRVFMSGSARVRWAAHHSPRPAPDGVRTRLVLHERVRRAGWRPAGGRRSWVVKGGLRPFFSQQEQERGPRGGFHDWRWGVRTQDLARAMEVGLSSGTAADKPQSRIGPADCALCGILRTAAKW